MTENSFLFQIDFDKKNQKISKYYVDKNKNTIIETNEFFKPLFFNSKEFSALNLINLEYEEEKNIFKSYSDDEITKITPKTLETKDKLIELIELYSMKTYEFDLKEQNYYSIETNEVIKGPINLRKTKIISLDIETLGTEENQYINLIANSSYCEEYSNKVFINIEALHTNFKELNEQILDFEEDFELIWCENEKELLENLIKDVKAFQPQFILGWNVIGFDFKVIKERCNKLGVPFEFSQFEGDYSMRVSSDFFGKDSLSFPGVLVLDCIQLLKTNYIQFSDYKLNSVAKEVLGESKIDLDESEEADFSLAEKIKTIEHNWNTNPKKLIWYNYKDSTLVLDIVEKLGLMDVMFERSIITQTPFERLQSPIAVLDQMYLKELHKRGNVANTHYPTTGTTPIEGAYIIDPTQGFYEDIVVFDFASLYPSIMITFNIDPFTYSEQGGDIIAPNDATFRKEKGILPNILKNIFNLRVQAKAEKNSIKSHALKITMNSFYGAMASSKARYYNKHLAEAITSFGRELLLEAKRFLESENIQVIYGDTDSVFVKANFEKNSNLKDKESWMEEMEKKINIHFTSWVKEKYGVESFLAIEAEKLFSKFYISTKKRYVGLDLNNELQFTGLEAIRGDWTDLAKEFQIKLIRNIFDGKTKEQIKKFVHEEIKLLKDGNYDEKLVYLKKITKPLSEYTKTTPPHVKAAREIPNFNGRVVKYVMNEKGPKHISLFDSNIMKYDYEHYIDKQLKGVSDEILQVIGLKFNDIIYEKKQTSLNKFF